MIEKSNVSRRAFLAGASALIGATTLPWRPCRAQQTNRTGEGAWIFEVVPDWGITPAGVQFGNTHAVQVLKDGRVVVHNQSKDAVAFFDPNGKYIKSWGPEFAAGAHGLQVVTENGQEFFYMADYVRHLCVKATPDGEIVWTLKFPKESGLYKDEGQYRPTNIAIAPDGQFWVADGYGQHYVHHYNAKAEYQKSWGGKGKEDGKFNVPHGIWYDNRGAQPRLLVADRENGRVQAFNLDGSFIGITTSNLRRPCHFDPRGEFLLIPELQGRATIINGKDEPVARLGDNPGVWTVKGWPNFPREQWVPGKFFSPHGACWDADGNVYISEYVKVGRVTKLRKVA
ncbi:MAG TPA: hypothetical protein VGB77_18490 [Abditibacteriaceae bacterium]|jgi:hypothetical protein